MRVIVRHTRDGRRHRQWAVVDDSAGIKNYPAVDQGGQRSEFMQNEQDRPSGPDEQPQGVRKCLLAAPVDPGVGLVEYEQVGVGGGSPGDEHSLLLPA